MWEWLCKSGGNADADTRKELFGAFVRSTGHLEKKFKADIDQLTDLVETKNFTTESTFTRWLDEYLGPKAFDFDSKPAKRLLAALNACAARAQPCSDPEMYRGILNRLMPAEPVVDFAAEKATLEKERKALAADRQRFEINRASTDASAEFRTEIQELAAWFQEKMARINAGPEPVEVKMKTMAALNEDYTLKIEAAKAALHNKISKIAR